MSFDAALLDRRQFLSRGAMGFGGLALSSLLGQDARAASPWSPRPPHFGPKAKSVIFLYMDGGVSQVDSFDPKPRLTRENGRKPKFKVDATVFNSNGNILQSPWDFKQYGESGIPVSDLFPHIGSCADELCVIRSMTAFSPNHPNANYSLHGGHILSGRPSMGAWVSYGLGTESQDLPSYVVIHGGQVPSSGMQCFGSRFLPSTHQASTFLPGNPVLQNIAPREAGPEYQRRKLRLLSEIDGTLQERLTHVEAIQSAIQNYEMACRMQMAVPDVADVSQESDTIKRLYGATDEYGYRVVQDKLTVHDLHANMLHLLGMDHNRLTYRYGGRDVRLTDVHGEIVPEILA